MERDIFLTLWDRGPYDSEPSERATANNGKTPQSSGQEGLAIVGCEDYSPPVSFSRSAWSASSEASEPSTGASSVLSLVLPEE